MHSSRFSVRRPALLGALSVILLGFTGCSAFDSISTHAQERPYTLGTRPRGGVQSPASSGSVPGTEITAIGDSVMLASSGALRESLPGIDIHAEESNQLADADDEIEALDARGQLRDVVVIGLGVNGVGDEQAARDAIAAAHGRRVVFVDVHGPAGYVPYVNDALRAVADSEGAVIAEWDEAISQQPDLLARDGIHPGDEGARLYARVVIDALDAAS